MAHFAQLDENNIVTQVIVVSNQDTSDENGNEVEEIGVSFCKNLFGSDTNWKQTSYHGNFRVRFARIDDNYDEKLDAFIPPKPYDSWTFDKNVYDWISSTPAPLTDKEKEWLSGIENSRKNSMDTRSIIYYLCNWDEENKIWIRIND